MNDTTQEPGPGIEEEIDGSGLGTGEFDGEFEPDDANASVIDRIKQQRQEVRGRHHLIMPVQGYEGLLAIRYNDIGSDATEQVGKKLRKELRARGNEGATLLGSLELLIRACDQVVVKEEGHAKCLPDDKGQPTVWRPIDPEAIPPVRFDQRLGRILGFEASGARDTVLALFPSDHAVIETQIRVSRWLVDATRDVTEDLLGE